MDAASEVSSRVWVSKRGLLSSVSVALLAVMGVGVFAGPARAQQSAPTGADVEEVVVTGSRIVTSGFTAPTPVTTLGQKEMEAQAPSNIGDVLTKLPSFRASSGPQIGGVTTRGGGQYFADLRGLGAARTLVLLDGRRYVPSGLSSTVDLNQIPTLMIERAEVVTGGASAAWGSDAVAGVLNLILKKDLDGIEGQVQYGQSELGDNRQWRASLAAGGTFADDRGRYIVGGDFDKQDGIGNQFTRKWGREEYNTIVNAAYATNGLPNYIISPGVHDATLYDGGIVTSGPLRGTAFGPGGQPFQYNYGQVFGSSMIGGDGYGLTRSRDATLASPIWRGNVLGHVSYEFTPDLSGFVELSYARSRLTGNSTPPRDAALVIRNDNPYLPAATRAAMATARVTSITIGRLGTDFGDPPFENNATTYRGVMGLKGAIPDGWYGDRWRWDAYVQYGKNKYNTFIFKNRINARWAAAIDAVRHPASGAIVCRFTLTNPTNGCRPVNVIGQNSITAADVDYLTGTQEYLLYTTETVASASVQGNPFSTWAGPVSVVFGAEYREETGSATSDAISREVQPNGTNGGFLLGNPQPFEGEYDLHEFFGEAVVPLARDVAWAKSLELNAAVRRTTYSTSGSVVTWKVGASYQPVEDLRFRATRSRDIRAPTLQEFFAPDTLAGFTPVLNNLTGLSPTTARHTSGNANLRPEVADTWTAGVVYRPSSAPRLQVSVDYYDVDIRDAIDQIDAGSVANNCYAGVTSFCQYLNRDTAGNIVWVMQPTLNLFSARTSGVDLEAIYGFDLESVINGAEGSLGLRLLATHVFKLISTDLSGPHNRVGQLSNHNGTTGVPHWSGVADLTYTRGQLTADLRARYIGSGVFNTDLREGAGAANTINDNSIPSKTYLSLSLQYELLQPEDDRRLQVFGTVTNLTNVEPAMAPANGGGSANATSTNPAFYDTVGRSYKVGLRFKY